MNITQIDDHKPRYKKRLKTAYEQHADDIEVITLSTIDEETTAFIKQCLNYSL